MDKLQDKLKGYQKPGETASITFLWRGCKPSLIINSFHCFRPEIHSIFQLWSWWEVSHCIQWAFDETILLAVQVMHIYSYSKYVKLLAISLNEKLSFPGINSKCQNEGSFCPPPLGLYKWDEHDSINNFHSLILCGILQEDLTRDYLPRKPRGFPI